MDVHGVRCVDNSTTEQFVLTKFSFFNEPAKRAKAHTPDSYGDLIVQHRKGQNVKSAERVSTIYRGITKAYIPVNLKHTGNYRILEQCSPPKKEFDFNQQKMIDYAWHTVHVRALHNENVKEYHQEAKDNKENLETQAKVRIQKWKTVQEEADEARYILNKLNREKEEALIFFKRILLSLCGARRYDKTFVAKVAQTVYKINQQNSYASVTTYDKSTIEKTINELEATVPNFKNIKDDNTKNAFARFWLDEIKPVIEDKTTYTEMFLETAENVAQNFYDSVEVIEQCASDISQRVNDVVAEGLEKVKDITQTVNNLVDQANKKGIAFASEAVSYGVEFMGDWVSSISNGNQLGFTEVPQIAGDVDPEQATAVLNEITTKVKTSKNEISKKKKKVTASKVISKLGEATFEAVKTIVNNKDVKKGAEAFAETVVNGFSSMTGFFAGTNENADEEEEEVEEEEESETEDEDEEGFSAPGNGSNASNVTVVPTNFSAPGNGSNITATNNTLV